MIQLRYQTRLKARKAWLLLAEQAPFQGQRISRHPAYRRGQIYERACTKRLEEQYGLQFLPGPWFRYMTDIGEGLCQVDGLVFDISAGRIYVIEVKVAHTRVAYAQLVNCYIPVLHAAGFLRTLFQLIPVEICSRFDSSEDLSIPGGSNMIHDLREARETQFNVMIWRASGWGR